MKFRNICQLAMAAALFIACENDPLPVIPDKPDGPDESTFTPDEFDGVKRAGITYQVLVYSFADSDGDGIGDLKGIEGRMDYFDRLGVSALWLSPIHPAASYHGYDVTDYYGIDPVYGTEADFKSLIDAAHKHNIEIYMDYVLNHSAAAHPWFQEAMSNPDSPYRKYYTFSSDPKSDIAAGKVPMIASEGANGYDSGQWFICNSGVGAKGRYRFDLNFANSSAPTITVRETSESLLSGTSKMNIYFGENKSVKFSDKGAGQYTLVADIDTDWGFLVRSDDTWNTGTKYGAKDAQTITLGQPFTIYKSTSSFDPKNITFSDPMYYHSHLWTSWFADFDFGAVSNCSESPAFKDLLASAGKWIGMGVDGLRLDAVKHIYHNENSTENPSFLSRWYDECNKLYKAQGHTGNMFMVGEVFSDANASAKYYKGLSSCFEFSFWWNLSSALKDQKANNFASDLVNYRVGYRVNRKDALPSLKLSNHDEDRAATTLNKSAEKLKQAAAFLMTAEGKPFIYQGEELGYWGSKSNGDEFVRSPIRWEKTGALAQGRLSGKVDNSMLTASMSVEAQEEDVKSLLRLYRELAQVRNTYPALAQGVMTSHTTYGSSSSQQSVACWYMTKGSERMLVVHNVSASKTVNMDFEDDLSKMAFSLGSAKVSKSGGKHQLSLGPNSSAIFKLY